MNSSIVRLCVSIFIFVIIVQKTNAQACGEGIFTLINYKGGEINKEKVSYEFFPIKEEFIDPYDNVSFADDLYIGEIIDENLFKEMLDTNCNPKFDELFNLINNEKSGVFIKGTIELKTFETETHPLILKLASAKKEIIIVAYFLGGCDRTTEIVWGEEPFLRDE